MSWSHIEQDELLSNETVIDARMAGAFIKLSAYGLSSLSYLNWAGTEKIGGKLHLTNYRLIFASNSWNRVVGKFSVFLSTIQGIKNTSFLLDRRIEISTESQIFEFQVWGIPKFTALIIEARDIIDATEKEQLRATILEEYPKLGEDFQKSRAAMITFVEKAAPLAHTIEHLSHGGNPLREILNGESPPTVSTILNVLEVLGEKKKAS